MTRIGAQRTGATGSQAKNDTTTEAGTTRAGGGQQRRSLTDPTDHGRAASAPAGDAAAATRRLARLTGVPLLVLAVLGMFAGTVSVGLLVAGDPVGRALGLRRRS
jgi:hypothetical protein